MEAASNGFGTSIDPKDVEDHIKSSDIVHLFVENEKIVGFAGYNTLGKEGILHLNGVVIKKEYQKRGYLKESISMTLNGYSYFTLRTQNPVMYYVATKIAEKYNGEVYPKINDNYIPPEIKRVGQVICKNVLNCNLPENSIFRWRLWKMSL